MPDERLRTLERRWSETGAPEDEAACLLERVRVGALGRAQLELAGYCGHRAARLALAADAPASSSDPCAWASGLKDFPQEASVVALVALVDAQLPAWTTFRQNDDLLPRALRAAKGWLASPSKEAAEQAARLAEALEGPAWELASLTDVNQMDRSDPLAEERRRLACGADKAVTTTSYALRAIGAPSPRIAAGHLLSVVRLLLPDLSSLQQAVARWALDDRGRHE